MPLYHKDVALPQDDLPVGYMRNGIAATTSFSQAQIPIVPTSGATDTTQFFLIFVPNIGIFDLSYDLSSYVSGTIQEAIFTHRSDMLGVGDTILNQNWASPSNSLRTITNVKMTRGYHWMCLRVSNGGQASTYTNGTTGNLANGVSDPGFYINSKRLNGTGMLLTTQNRNYRLWDNSSNPATVVTYNGSLSDFSTYQNVSNKYLYSNNTENGPTRVRLTRKS